MDELSFVETVDRLGEGIVIAVADAADRRLDAGLGQALCILYRHVLRSPVRMVDEPAAVRTPRR